MASGICYVLMQSGAEGHSCVPEALLRLRTRELLKLPDSRETEELIESQLKKLAVERRVVIRRDTVDGVKQFVEDAGYTWPIYFDTESRGAYAYGVYSIPVTYFMNERGEIVSSRLGAMTQEDLQEQIQNILPDRQ